MRMRRGGAANSNLKSDRGKNVMNLFLILAFLFFIGSVTGWVLELFFRRFISVANPERKWINPGFCVGPYVPLYGFGLCFMYLIASLEKVNLIENPVLNKLVLFVVMAICMTVIEYIAGILVLKTMNVRLWDYSDMWGNIQGIICPLFSAIWAVLGAVYYFFIHPHILNALNWLSANLAFSFVIGVFFGVFSIDVAYSAKLISKLRAFAAENEVIVRYENLKAHIRSMHDNNMIKTYFFFPFKSDKSVDEYLKDIRYRLEKKYKKSETKGSK